MHIQPQQGGWMKWLSSWLRRIQGREQELLPNLSTNKSSFGFLISLDGNDIQKSTTKSCLNHQTRPETMTHVACHLRKAVRPRGSSRVFANPKIGTIKASYRARVTGISDSSSVRRQERGGYSIDEAVWECQVYQC
jgi:hypothetical protein